MANRLKRPKANQGKQVRVATLADPAPQSQYPVFSLRHLQPGFSLRECDTNQKAALAEKMHQLSQMTWIEIINAPRHGSGSEKIARLAIQAPVPAFISDDVNFLAIRFYGNAPMVGYRDGATFHILWLDRAFRLYDHG